MIYRMKLSFVVPKMNILLRIIIITNGTHDHNLDNNNLGEEINVDFISNFHQ